jgi:HAE1 family hydrophobic/amphiphilic exporter-1
LEESTRPFGDTPFASRFSKRARGGTITSTVLTLLVIPTVYEILVGWRERLRNLFRRRTRVRTHAEPETAGGG